MDLLDEDEEHARKKSLLERTVQTTKRFVQRKRANSASSRRSDASFGNDWGSDSDEETGGEEEELVTDVLVVNVLKARGLLASDSNGLSDPYVSIKFCLQKKKTKVVRKSLDPEWNETFEFKAKRPRENPNALDNEKVVLTLKDKDLFFDDMLGAVEIPVWGIIEKATKAASASSNSTPSPSTTAQGLVNQTDDSDENDKNDENCENDVDSDQNDENDEDERGSVGSVSSAPQLDGRGRQTSTSTSKIRSYMTKLVRRYSSGEGRSLSYRTFSTGAKWYTLDRASGMKTVKGSIKIEFIYYKVMSFNSFPTPSAMTATDATDSPNIRDELRHFAGRPRVTITVLQARNIPVSDINGLSDPYVVLSCRGTRHRTATKQRTLNPVWNEEFTFGDESEYLVQRDVVTIKVYDKDVITSLPICVVELPLWVLDAAKDEPYWFRLTHLPENIPAPIRLLHHSDHAEDAFGEIQLKVRLTGESEHNSNQNAFRLYNGKVWFYELKMRICSARHLDYGGDENENAQIYAVIRCGKRKARTSKVPSSQNPIWKDYFTFSDSSVPKSRGLTRKDLVNVVIRMQRSNGKDEVLGRCDLDLAYIIDKVGYIDLEGKRLLKTFDLSVPSGPRHQQHQLLGVGKRKPQVRLSLELKPIAETRMASYNKVVLKLDKLKNLRFCAGSRLENVRKVYIKGTVGTYMFEVVSSALSAGFVYMNHHVWTSSFESKALRNTKVILRIYADVFETLIGTVTIDLATLEEDQPLEQWYPLDITSLEDILPPLQDGSMPVRQRSADSIDCNVIPELYACLRLKRVEHELRPVLGYIDLKLVKLKMFTDGFDHSFRAIIRYGPIVVSSRTYLKQNNVVFEDTEEANFKLPVHDMYTPLHLAVVNVKGRHGTQLKGKTQGSATLSVFDLIEWEAKLAFFDNAIARPAIQRPIKLDLRDTKGRSKGSLVLLARFDERTSGTLATNANPSAHPKAAVNIKAVFHEMNRASKILEWMMNLSRFSERVMNWETPSLSMFFIATLVTICSVDFWISRAVAFVPIALIVHVLHKYAERRAGVVITGAAEKIGAKDVKGRLLVTAVRGEGLVPMDPGGKSDPFVQIGYRNCSEGTASTVHRIGKTRTVPKTLNPDWSHNIYGFKTRKGASLFAWGSPYKDHVVPAFEAYIPKSVFKNTHLQLRALHLNPRRATIHPWENVQSLQIHAQVLRPSPSFFVPKRSQPIVLAGSGAADTAVPLIQEDEPKVELVERFRQVGSPNRGSRSPKRKRGKWEGGTVVGEEFTFTEFQSEGVVVVRLRRRDAEEAAVDAFGFIPLPQVLTYLARHRLASLKFWLPIETYKDGAFSVHADMLVQILALGVGFDVEGFLSDEDETDLRQNGLINAEVITTAKRDMMVLEDSWDNSQTVITFDVVDEDVVATEFMGRAELPLADLVNDSTLREQHAVRKWLPLTFRFDGSKADENLLQKATVAKTATTTPPRSHRGTHAPKSRRPSSLFNRLHHVFVHRKKSKPQQPDTLAPTLREVSHSAYEPTSEYPFGRILVQAQIVLPEPGAEEKLRAAEELRKAEKVGVLEVNKLLKLYNKRLQWFHSQLFAFNNRMERMKNLFNWTHPKKTKLVLFALIFLSAVFILLPSRYIFMAAGLFLLTEHFRPLGVIKIKLQHLLALCPTDQDVLDVYNNGAIFSGSEKVRLQDSNGKREPSSPHSLSKTKLLHLGTTPKPVSLVSEGSVLIGGHLRVLLESSNPSRTHKWRRYYCVVAHGQLMYWTNKSDVYTTPCTGAISQLTSCIPIAPDTPYAKMLLQRGCSPTEVTSAFALHHSTHSLTSTKTLVTLIVANSERKCKAWVVKLSTACQQSNDQEESG